MCCSLTNPSQRNNRGRQVRGLYCWRITSSIVKFVLCDMSYLSFAEVSSSRAKKPGPGEEIKDEKQRWLKVVDMGLFNKLNCSLFLMIFAWCGFRLKELETSIRSQVAAEERAHKIVERLVLEVEVTRDFLVNSVSLIVFEGKMARIQGKGSSPKIFVEQLCTCQCFSPGPGWGSGIPTGSDISPSNFGHFFHPEAKISIQTLLHVP